MGLVRARQGGPEKSRAAARARGVPPTAPPPRRTRRAEMRATLPDHNPADRRAAHRARLPVTLVNPEVILEVAAAVDPVETGAVVAQAGTQRGAQAAPQAPDLIVVQ